MHDFESPVANSNHSYLESGLSRPRMVEIMYVCLCNGITDRQLVEAAADLAFQSGTGDLSLFAEQVADQLGAGLRCGSCRDFAIDLVERAAAQQVPVMLPERGRAASGLDPLPGRRGDSAFRLSAGRKEDALAPRGA